MGTLLTTPWGRLRLCRRLPGLRRALGWRGALLGARPVPGLARTLGWGVARSRAVLPGSLLPHGRPRLRRHVECAERLGRTHLTARLPWAVTACGLGPGLPAAASAWPDADGEACRARAWLDLPHDGAGAADWEQGEPTGGREVWRGRAALAAAEVLEDRVDAAWLLRGVAVVLPAPSGH